MEAAVAVGGGGVVVVLQGVGVGQSPGQGGAIIRLLGSKKNNTFFILGMLFKILKKVFILNMF